MQKGFVARRYLTPHVNDSGSINRGSYNKESSSSENAAYEELICRTSSPIDKSNWSAASSPRSSMSSSDSTLQTAAASDQKSPTFASSVAKSRSSVTSSERTSTGYLTAPQSDEGSQAASSVVEMVSLTYLLSLHLLSRW